MGKKLTLIFLRLGENYLKYIGITKTTIKERLRQLKNRTFVDLKNCEYAIIFVIEHVTNSNNTKGNFSIFM